MQASLFAPLEGLQPVEMEDAQVHFMQALYGAEQAQRYFEQLHAGIAWRHETLHLWGKQLAQPRLSAWYGDIGRRYSYSGLQLQALPWTPLLSAIKRDIEAVSGESFNSVLLNLYRNEQDSVAWHSDDETELGPKPVIASLSLGATRTFKFRHKTTGRMVSLDLDAGSLLLMAGDTQRCWKHAVLKEKSPSGPRINLTFRQIRC